MLADRYRVVALLGKGGMGEVYRADDLTLGQTVALKFLPRSLAADESARQLLYREVRLGRQVSHPNICRLYDVVDWQGHVFVSMEYIDGEDLASLLRRIGPPPEAKLHQLARQICSGLAAAHRAGVVHRDLKPANIMIDGRGSARITDFGLAVLDDEAAVDREIAGTPVYMAPEQLRGEGTSVRSDLFALGLVLFEMYTGERLFAGASLPELLREHESGSAGHRVAATFSDPTLERAIARCLESRPEDRPPSVHAVLAALPGGDALQAALDAGETPSPEQVAAAEGSGTLRPSVAIGIFALLALLVLLNAAFTERWGQIPGYIEVPDPPLALATRAADLLRELGVPVRSGDQDYGWDFDWDRRYWIAENDAFSWWGRGRDMAPSPVFLWYRHSPTFLRPLNHRQRISEQDPPLTEPGMASLRVDAQGRLLSLVIAPQERNAAGPTDDTASAAEWQRLLDATGLVVGSLEAVTPEWTPPVGATERRAWTGIYPDQDDLVVRVEGASIHGKPVWLRVVPPWVVEAAEKAPADPSLALWATTEILRSLLFLLLLAAGALLARANWRRGRGDRRGAVRLAVYMAVTTFAYLVLQVDFVPDRVASQAIAQFGSAISQAFVAWLFYLAVEPHLRSLWPRLMIGWHRLLSGRLRDPLVGREILAGLVVGVAYAAFSGELAVQLRIREIPFSVPLEALARSRDLLSRVVEEFQAAGMNPMVGGLILVISTIVLRRRHLAVAGVWLAFLLMGADWIFDLRYAVLLQVALATCVVFVLIRVGLVAFGAMMAGSTWVDLPMTLDAGRWYFLDSLVPIALLLGLGAWAAWNSAGGRPIAGALLGADRAAA